MLYNILLGLSHVFFGIGVILILIYNFNILGVLVIIFWALGHIKLHSYLGGGM